MTKEQQKQFVRELAESVIEKIMHKIDFSELPEDWGGVELREYMALCFKRQTPKGSF